MYQLFMRPSYFAPADAASHRRRSVRWRPANSPSHKPLPVHKCPASFSAKTVRMNCCRICSFQGTVAGFFTKALVGLSRLELPTSRLSGVRSNRLSYKPVCCFQHSLPTAWRRRDSNSRPPACKAGALPTELRPHMLAATCSATPSPA